MAKVSLGNNMAKLTDLTVGDPRNKNYFSKKKMQSYPVSNPSNPSNV
jgi:hypothetical protein